MSVDEFAATLSRMVGSAGKQTTFVYGLVSGVSPLVVKVEGEPDLTESFLIVGVNCRERKAYFDTHSHEILAFDTEIDSSSIPHSHEVFDHSTEDMENYIIVNRGLKAGDKVLMLRANDGQKYYLLERIGEDRA